ncbi:MAG: neutral zinc metallopeptidase [Chitinophagaceae bacterium]|nr:neutral zinc metallopeptidase [Chitinophagaceae bacterium]
MLWKGRRQSDNVDDRRGMSTGGLAVGGGVIGVIILVLNLLLGGDPSNVNITELLPGQQGSTQLSPAEEAADNERAEFVKVTLAETEDVWNKIFREAGRAYPEPTLVLFRNTVQSGCGTAGASSGPFYCPGDNKLYIDLSFYEELQNRFKAPGDFAMAYVVAHEVGHHVQTVLGTSAKLARARQQMSEKEYNKLSVKMELQADFLAGVWAHYANQKKILESGDIEEALTAANAIGDDRLQKESMGRTIPDAFTHGTSAQRMYWFKKGFETGDMSQGDTFSDPSLN